MRYLPNSDSDRAAMLNATGRSSVEELFDRIPEELRLRGPLNLPGPLSEPEILEYFRQAARSSAAEYVSLLGAGAYTHYVPVAVNALLSRSEFFTAYTPYQAEIAQGTLQAMFEFQTLMTQLTGMEVGNASLYDGSTATTEAVLMALRVTRRNRVLVARTVHPEYNQVLKTFVRHQGTELVQLPYEESGQLDLSSLETALNAATAAVVVQSPNFFGIVDEVRAAAEIAHKHGALLILVFTEAVSLGLLEPVREADIVAGELQSFAISPSFGGPYAGVIATRDKFVRQMPGRLVGQSTDSRGQRAFCLTLATREQHIRREKATSNICTNQALVALMATVFMTVYGKQGLRELALQNLAKAHYLAGKVKPRFSGKFFNEFVCGVGDPEARNQALLEKKIVGGLPLGRFYPELADSVLLCATEMSRRADMDAVAEVLR